MFLIAVPPFIAVPLVNIITELASTKLFVTVSVVSEDPKLTEPAIALIILFPVVPEAVMTFPVAINPDTEVSPVTSNVESRVTA